MTASQNDSKTFHKLIRSQRSNHCTYTDVIYIGDKKYEGDSIIKGWECHFEMLGTPNFEEKFDLEGYHIAGMQNKIIEENEECKQKKIEPTTNEEVENAIKNLNTGKAADENGISSEHYKHAPEELSPEITSIINQIFQELDVPQSLKNGILTPILKKKKDKTIPGNYRGIVVTSTFSKIFEDIIKGRLEPKLLPSQNLLQRGFTARGRIKFVCCFYYIRNNTAIPPIANKLGAGSP